MILVGKAAAGPSENGQPHLFESIDHINPHTVDIGYIGILAYKKAFVNASAEMLGKIAVDILADGRFLLVGIDEILFHSFLRLIVF